MHIDILVLLQCVLNEQRAIIALLCAVQRGDRVLDMHQACYLYTQKHATKRVKACITHVKACVNYDKTAKKNYDTPRRRVVRGRRVVHATRRGITRVEHAFLGGITRVEQAFLRGIARVIAAKFLRRVIFSIG